MSRLAVLVALSVPLSLGCAVDRVQLGEEKTAITDADLDGSTGTGLTDGGEVIADAGADAGTGADPCWSAWATPSARLTATAPAASTSQRYELTYGFDAATQTARVELSRITGAATAALPSGPPLSVNANSGSWFELRDSGGNTLYTRAVNELIPESFEAVGPGGSGFTHIFHCPTSGVAQLSNLPLLPNATELVLFQEPLDGVSTNRTVLLARIPLP